MKQEIRDNSYYLLADDGRVLLKLTPSDMSGDQIVLETEDEVFAGPVKFIRFSEDIMTK